MKLYFGLIIISGLLIFAPFLYFDAKKEEFAKLLYIVSAAIGFCILIGITVYEILKEALICKLF